MSMRGGGKRRPGKGRRKKDRKCVALFEGKKGPKGDSLETGSLVRQCKFRSGTGACGMPKKSKTHLAVGSEGTKPTPTNPPKATGTKGKWGRSRPFTANEGERERRVHHLAMHAHQFRRARLRQDDRKNPEGSANRSIITRKRRDGGRGFPTA